MIDDLSRWSDVALLACIAITLIAMSKKWGFLIVIGMIGVAAFGALSLGSPAEGLKIR